MIGRPTPSEMSQWGFNEAHHFPFRHIPDPEILLLCLYHFPVRHFPDSDILSIIFHSDKFKSFSFPCL